MRRTALIGLVIVLVVASFVYLNNTNLLATPRAG